MQRQNGFTLIEIMMVIAIIGILAAIAVPSYQRYIHAAKAEDLLTHIYALREKTAIANNTGDWPAKLQSPAHEGIWPDGVTFNPGMLQIEHFKTQISIVDNNRPLAVFIATDADGRFIVDEVRKHLPEHLIHGYFNRTLIGVWLLDKQVSKATTATTTYTPPVLQPLPQPSQPVASQASAAQSATVGNTQTSQPTIPQQSGTAAATTQVVAQQSTPPPVQTSHVPVVSIPAECLKPNGGYYHRNPHRPNCPL